MNGKRAGIRLLPRRIKPFFMPAAVFWGWIIRHTPIADTITRVNRFLISSEENRSIS
jgi:hypothetical protein